MNDAMDLGDIGFDERYAVGQPVPRSEDPVLLRGVGHYTDDFSAAGQAHAVASSIAASVVSASNRSCASSTQYGGIQ